MRQYARAKDVHRCMRNLLWPWFLDAGWRKRPGYTCAFVRNDLILWVQPHSYGDSWSGSQLTLNLNKSESHEIAHGDRILWRLDGESRRVGSEIERRIVAKLPNLTEPDVEVRPESWEFNRDVWLRYYAEDDLAEWSKFLTPRLEGLLSTARTSW